MTELPAVVAPGLVVAGVDRQDGISAFGALLHLARLNHFGGADFRAAFRLHFKYRDDLSQLLAFSVKRQMGLALVVANGGPPPGTWGMEAWQPFSGKGPWGEIPWSLRACSACLRFGYHSNLFQLPWVVRCPWHDVRLIERCRKCGRSLLDGFRVGRPLMQCACGIDYVDEHATLNGDLSHAEARSTFVRAYLDWARTARESMTLICPDEFDVHGHEVVSALVTPVTALTRWDRCFAKARPGTHVDHLQRRATPEPLGDRARGSMVNCANSLWPGTPGMAELPEAFLAPLLGVTREIARRVPDAELTSREREALALEPVPAPASVPSRHSLMLLPVQRGPGRLFLDVRVLHRTAYRVLSHLAWHLVNEDPARYHPTSGAPQVLLAAVKRTLSRAYADGFKHVLGRHVPALYDHRRILSGPRIPWVLLERDSVGVAEVKIAWAARRPWHEPAQCRSVPPV